jgi:hypothetical protein
MHTPVCVKCVPMVEPGAEQHGLPKVTHHRQVLLQAAGAQVGERLGKELVVKRPPIEATQ